MVAVDKLQDDKSNSASLSLSLSLPVYMYILLHTHTHTYIYIYMLSLSLSLCGQKNAQFLALFCPHSLQLSEGGFQVFRWPPPKMVNPLAPIGC